MIKINKLNSEYSDIDIYQISIFLGEDDKEYISNLKEQLQ